MLSGLFLLAYASLLALGVMRGTVLESYKQAVEENKQYSKLAFLAPYSLVLIYILKLEKRIPKTSGKIYHNILLLHGQRRALIMSKMFLADAVSISVLLTVFGSMIGMMMEDNLVFTLGGFILSWFIPLIQLQELEKKVKTMKREITMELPEFLNKLILLVNAGETVQKALIRCVKQKKSEDKPGALYLQLGMVAAELENGYSFHQSMEEFSKRCGVQEATVFSTTMLLNYNRGGEEFVASLREISRDLWEKRKNITKTLGEQASSKMLFPMIFIFLVIMVIVGYPALTLM
jgi:tight adherence protein C